MASDSLLAPFTVIDQLYKQAFTAYLNNASGAIETAVAGPLLACVTLWIIVQGVLVMRGDIAPRQGITKLITVALVVGIVTSGNLYQEYVQSLFVTGIPNMVQKLGGNFGLPNGAIPTELDIVWRAGEIAFQKVAAQIGEMDNLDAMAFDFAQFMFDFTLWGIFGVYDIIGILTSVLVTVGPIFIIGFLFSATRDMASRWIGQLVSYAILLMLTSIVATIVVTIIAGTMATMFVVTIGDTEAGQIIGLYSLDFFIMTGNALVVALPAIAANIGGGVAVQGTQIAQSAFRGFARDPDRQTLSMGSFMS